MDVKLLSKSCAPLSVVGEDAQIQTQRNYFNLPGPPNSKGVANLDALLSAHHYQPVGNESGQQPFDGERVAFDEPLVA